MLLGLEAADQVEAAGEAAAEQDAPAKRVARAASRRANRGSLPSHLPHIEMLVDIESHACPCCSGALHRIGEDRAERLDIIPAQFRILVIRRPKYACRSCEEVVLQAPAPVRLIEGGIPTEATVAQVLVSKYADHLPLYRQAQIYARQGINLDRCGRADEREQPSAPAPISCRNGRPPGYEFSMSRQYRTVSSVVGTRSSSDAPKVGVCTPDSLPGSWLPNQK
jgi:transposase